MNCPYCKYIEVWYKTSTANFFFCKHEECKKVSCIVWFKSFKISDNDDENYQEEGVFEEMQGENGKVDHFKCYEFKDIKAEWDAAIFGGNSRVWPNCKIGGQKDDECMHMTCGSCQTVWCYFWGGSERDVDKSTPDGSIYSHNVNWDTNSKRCPMYLTRISDIDDRYTDQCDSTNKEFFHKLLTYKNISAFLDKHSMEQYKQLSGVFPTVGQHGYDLSEVLTYDTTLIIR